MICFPVANATSQKCPGRFKNEINVLGSIILPEVWFIY